MKAHDEAYRRFWTARPGAGSAERRVIAEHNKLSEADQVEEEAAWFMARLDALLQDCEVEVRPVEVG